MDSGELSNYKSFYIFSRTFSSLSVSIRKWHRCVFLRSLLLCPLVSPWEISHGAVRSDTKQRGVSFSCSDSSSCLCICSHSALFTWTLLLSCCNLFSSIHSKMLKPQRTTSSFVFSPPVTHMDWTRCKISALFAYWFDYANEQLRMMWASHVFVTVNTQT